MAGAVACGDEVVGQEGCIGVGVSCEGPDVEQPQLNDPFRAAADVAATRVASAQMLDWSCPHEMVVDDRGTTWCLSQGEEASLLRIEPNGQQQSIAIPAVAREKAPYTWWLALDEAGLPVVTIDDGTVIHVDAEDQVTVKQLDSEGMRTRTSGLAWLVPDLHGGYYAHTFEGIMGFSGDGLLRFRQTQLLPREYGYDIPQFVINVDRAAVVSEDFVVALVESPDERLLSLVMVGRDGNTRFAKTVGTSDWSLARSVALDPEGNIVLAVADSDTAFIERISSETFETLESYEARRIGFTPLSAQLHLAVDASGTILTTALMGSRDAPEVGVCSFNRDRQECVSVPGARSARAITSVTPGTVLIQDQFGPLFRATL